jgi:hypothetical protein
MGLRRYNSNHNNSLQSASILGEKPDYYST